jgi:outer membrane biosynthesis protein TonB
MFLIIVMNALCGTLSPQMPRNDIGCYVTMGFLLLVTKFKVCFISSEYFFFFSSLGYTCRFKVLNKKTNELTECGMKFDTFGSTAANKKAFEEHKTALSHKKPKASTTTTAQQPQQQPATLAVSSNYVVQKEKASYRSDGAVLIEPNSSCTVSNARHDSSEKEPKNAKTTKEPKNAKTTTEPKKAKATKEPKKAKATKEPKKARKKRVVQSSSTSSDSSDDSSDSDSEAPTVPTVTTRSRKRANSDSSKQGPKFAVDDRVRCEFDCGENYTYTLSTGRIKQVNSVKRPEGLIEYKYLISFDSDNSFDEEEQDEERIRFDKRFH